MKSKLRRQVKSGRKRGETTEKLLGILFDMARGTGDVIEAVLTSPYGSSYSYLSRRASEVERGRSLKEERFKKEKLFRNLLYRLQKDKLIEKESKKGILWRVTKKGMYELRLLQKHRKQYPPITHYPDVDEGEMKIIAFDVPEKYKYKRRWLRDVLKAFEFQMVQKSVWAGKAELPQKFLDDVRELNLISYIEIFAVTKSGSLEKLKL